MQEITSEPIVVLFSDYGRLTATPSLRYGYASLHAHQSAEVLSAADRINA